MYRNFTCGELRLTHIGQEPVLAGWVQTVRNLGAMTFIDIRDRYGITQLVADENTSAQLKEQFDKLGREYVIQVKGVVRERSSKNLKIPTGEVEVDIKELTVLNKAPVLMKSTPEGARDFVVPSRMNPNQFYALPQSPQIFKQLLMVAGFDRYYQIVKCFRDEDLRADRQPEFTQIDCEMSFVEQEDVLNMFEGLARHMFKEIKGIDPGAFPRITWADAMENYGNDKPDIRFGMKFKNLTDLVKGKEFKVFDEAEYIVGICAPGCGEYTRKQLDALTEFVKRPQVGAKGLVYAKVNEDGSVKSSVDKFYTQEDLAKMGRYFRGKAWRLNIDHFG